MERAHYRGQRNSAGQGDLISFTGPDFKCPLTQTNFKVFRRPHEQRAHSHVFLLPYTDMHEPR
jgi:hypothetical protein